MRFELDGDQQALLDGVTRILAEHAGPERARELGGDAATYDHALDALLREHGYLGFEFGDASGPLDATLIVEAVATRLGVVAVGGPALVVPGVLADMPRGPVAVARVPHAGRGPVPVRYAGDAVSLLAVGEDEALIVELGPDTVEPAASRFGYPLATVHRWEGASLGPGSAARARAWWRVALAAELVGTMRAALDLTVRHVRDRLQFGRPIGSFQAVQHRLAECEVLVQGSRFLTLEAAWSGAPAEAAAVALTHTSCAAARVFWETHQFSGAIGFSTEYDLHLWTMRLPTLRAEATAIGTPARALAEARWLVPAP